MSEARALRLALVAWGLGDLALGRRAEAEAQLRAALALEPANPAIKARLTAMGLAP